MPKLKTHRGAAKRFRLTARGRIKRSHAYKNHILTKKDPKRKRHLDMETFASNADAPVIRKMLPYGRP